MADLFGGSSVNKGEEVAVFVGFQEEKSFLFKTSRKKIEIQLRRNLKENKHYFSIFGGLDDAVKKRGFYFEEVF
jgi:hypothetical protein